MCDYSLMAVPNRLAAEGEDLVGPQVPNRLDGIGLTRGPEAGCGSGDKPNRGGSGPR